MEIVTAALATASLLGSAYAVLAAWAVRRFVRLPAPSAAASPPVTVLKPLHGAEAEPAISVARRVIADFADLDLSLVIDPRVVGTNLKISNLENMVALAKHDVFVIADSDMHVAPDYLREVTAPLADEDVGLVTCVYRGRPVGGTCARLAAMFVNHGFLPSALIGERMRPGDACFGATMALRRDIYATIGGFAALRDQLADDYALGAAIRRAGKRIVLSPQLVDTMMADPDLRAMIGHELRWARTIRLIAPIGFAASVVTHPLALSLIATLALGFPPAMLAVLAIVLACRLAMVRIIDRALDLPAANLWLVPIRDMLSFAVFIASFLGNRVAWRDSTFRIAADGRLVAIGDDRA